MSSAPDLILFLLNAVVLVSVFRQISGNGVMRASLERFPEVIRIFGLVELMRDELERGERSRMSLRLIAERGMDISDVVLIRRDAAFVLSPVDRSEIRDVVTRDAVPMVPASMVGIGKEVVSGIGKRDCVGIAARHGVFLPRDVVAVSVT
jgi:hypothetical protein